MATPLDISTFVYQTGTLNITPGDTTAVFSGASLASSVKDGDYLFAGGSLAVIQTVTDDTHVDLFTEWAGAGVSAGPYLILKASLLRYHTALIGYDSASFLAMLDGTTVWYAVEGAAPDPSIGEDGNRALKSNVTPWVVWLKTGGVWVEQAGSPGGPGATILVQNAVPDTSHPDNSLWIDSDSADLDVYALTGSPLAWADTGMNLKGATGPASLKPIEAWVTATAYVTGPPASFVSQSGSAYECLISHTSGTFATDLAAGKWGIVAAKGTDGTGTGDVVGPASAVDAHIALFDGATGKLLKDSGKSVSDFATAAQGAKADSALQSSDVGTAATHAATDFATAAQAVPAGGATGQVLAKASATNNDVAWINPSGGMTDEQRRNALLDRIYQSKALASYRRGLNVFADGFKSTSNDGIVTGSSSNFTAGGTGFVTNTTSAGSRISSGITPTAPHGGTAANANDNNTGTTLTTTGWGDQTAVSEPNSRIIVKFDLGADTLISKLEVIGASISQFNGTPQFWYSTAASGGGAGSWTAYGSALSISSTAANYSASVSVTARYVMFAVGREAYNGSQTFSVQDFNVYGAPIANNMTIISTPQLCDSAVSNCRVLLEYDNSASPTLNTDLTAEVSCDGGTNWSTCALSAITAYSQGGRSVAESADTSCTSGGAFEARIKTLNNKNVPIYGVSLTAH